MQSKGNIDIFDETKIKGFTSDIKKNEDSVRPKGNVDIIDETKEHAKESPENGKEACRNPERFSITENTVKENLEYGESTDQRNEETVPTNKICTQHKDTNNNAKLNTDGESNGNDDDTNLYCNENNSFSVDGKVTSTEISETERGVTSASTNELSNSRITENKELSEVQDSHRLPFQTKAFSAESNASATAGDLSPCSQNSSIKSFEKASDDCADPCDFCKRSSQFLCEFCTFFYCKSCLDRVHPAIGPYKSHKVIPVQEGVRVEHYKRCREHGLVSQLFCSYCEVYRCTECFKTRCRLHFKGRVSAADIEKERELLVEELERATAKLGFLEKYKENVQDQIDNIQLTGMIRRDQIRQEFVSFHDLLIQKEAKMLHQLDQDVTERVDHVVNTLQASVRALEQEDARLTTTVIELIQSGNDAYFIEEYVTAKDLCRQVDDKVRDFDREWAKNCTFVHSPLLDNHFTMIVEKKQLSERLDGTMEQPKLKFKQSTLSVDSQNILLLISDYLEPPLIPTSTELSYNLELVVDGEVVYSKQTRKLQDLKLNTSSTYQLHCGKRYLLKVIPTYTGLANSVDCQNVNTWQGKPCHMLILVSKARPKLVSSLKTKKAVRKISFQRGMKIKTSF